MSAAIVASIYAAMIHDRLNFAQASYRDGEWSAILGVKGRNINGERYHPDLGEALRTTLQRPHGQWCVFWPHGTTDRTLHLRASEWIAARKPHVRWIADRPLGRANEAGELAPFFRALHGRRVILVGPQHMEQLDTRVLLPAVRVEVPNDGTAWMQAPEIAETVGSLVHGDSVVLFAAGMATNLIIWRLLANIRFRETLTLIDVGALLDPYCGVYSRKAYQSAAWQRYLMPRNIPS